MTTTGKILWIVGLLFAAIIAFTPGFGAPFVIDDVAKIRENPMLRKSVPSFQDFFGSYESDKTHFRNDPSRPLTYFAYWVFWQMGEGSSIPFHVASVFFHLLLAGGVGLLFLHLFGLGPTPVLASFVFLLHPLNAGTVLYAFGFSDILVAGLTMAMALAAIKPQPSLIKIGLLFVLALMAKQSAVVIPVLIFALNPKAKKLNALLFAMAVVYVALRFIVYGRIGDLEAVETYPALKYAAAQGAATWKYVWLFLWPSGLSIDHADFPHSYPQWLKTVGWSAWFLLTGVSARTFLRGETGRPRALALGWLWFAVPLLPTGSIFPTTDILVERRVYGATIGLLMVGAALWPKTIAGWPRRGFIAAFSVLVISFGVLTFKRAVVHSSIVSLHEDLARKNPDDERSLNNLATAYIHANRIADARAILEKVLSKYPDHRDALVNLAAILQAPEYQMVDLPRAKALLERALTNEPNNLNALVNYGFLKLSERDPVAAQGLFEKAITLSPCQPKAHYGLAVVAKMKGRDDDVTKIMNRALECDPGLKKQKDQP